MKSKINEKDNFNNFNNKMNRNSLGFEKFKIKKIKYSNAEYKKKIDEILQKLLIDTLKSKTKNFKNINNNIKINFKLQSKNPTPFQIYERIKSIKLKHIANDNKKFDNIRLTHINKSSSISTSTKHLQNPKASKKIYMRNKLKFISPFRKRFLNNKVNSFGKTFLLNDNSNDLSDFSNWFIKNDIIRKDNKIKNNIGRNTKIKISNLKIKKDNNKKNNLSNDNISFYEIQNNNKMKNLPIINKNNSQQIILHTQNSR